MENNLPIKKNNSKRNLLDTVRGWPVERKRIFSIVVAIVLTILVIILNSAINIWWPEAPKVTPYAQTEAINSMQDSFSQIFNQVAPTLNQAISSSTQLIEQINSTSSSSSTGTNVVR